MQLEMRHRPLATWPLSEASMRMNAFRAPGLQCIKDFPGPPPVYALLGTPTLSICSGMGFKFHECLATERDQCFGILPYRSIPGKSNLLEVDFVHLHDVRVVQRPQRARIGASRLGGKGWEPRGPRSS